MKIPANVITNFNRGKTDSQLLCGDSYTTLYEDLVPPELLSVAGLTGAAGSKAEKYSFVDFATYATTFTLSFSEKVVGAGTATLSNAALQSTKTFAFGDVGGASSGAISEIDAATGRTVTLKVADAPLEPGAWALSIPYASLTDTATETGVVGNPFVVAASCAEDDAAVRCAEDDACCMVAGSDAATATITVNEAGNTAPTCTVASNGVVQDSEVTRGTDFDNDRTLVLQFEEVVKIRDTTGSIKLYASGAAGDPEEVLSMGLDGETFVCDSTTGVCDSTTTGALEFKWLDGCTRGDDGCSVADDPTYAGGGQYLFVFLRNLKYVAEKTSYYFQIEAGSSEPAIVTEYDFPIETSKLGEFSVHDPFENYTPQVMLDAASPRGPYDNLLVTFSERVEFGSALGVTFTSADRTACVHSAACACGALLAPPAVRPQSACSRFSACSACAAGAAPS